MPAAAMTSAAALTATGTTTVRIRRLAVGRRLHLANFGNHAPRPEHLGGRRARFKPQIASLEIATCATARGLPEIRAPSEAQPRLV